MITAATANPLFGIVLGGGIFGVVRGQVENHCVSHWYREFGELKVKAFLADLPGQYELLRKIHSTLRDLLDQTWCGSTVSDCGSDGPTNPPIGAKSRLSSQ
jgi:hypothetical protein